MKVFISYAQQDAALAGRVAEALQGDGLEVWNAERNLLPGDNWAAEVGRALEESEAMVVLLTPEAIGSRWVMREMDYALGAKNYRNRLIPVVVGDREGLPTATSHGSFGECLGLNSATAKLPRSSRLRTPFAATRDPAAVPLRCPTRFFSLTPAMTGSSSIVCPMSWAVTVYRSGTARRGYWPASNGTTRSVPLSGDAIGLS